MSAIKLETVREPIEYMATMEAISYSYNYFRLNEKKIVEYGVKTECPIKYSSEATSIRKVLMQLGIVALAKGAIKSGDIELFPEYNSNKEIEDLESIERVEARILDIFSRPETGQIIKSMNEFMIADKRSKNMARAEEE